MSNSGRQGELIFFRKMRDVGYIVNDVSGDPEYWAKDQDFLITSPKGNTKSFEVKFDTRINQTGNLYIEISNVHSKNGEGWFKFCQADFLAYGDAQTKVFYVIEMSKLRERVQQLPQRYTNCGTDSIGLLVNLRDIQDIILTTI